MLTLLRHAAPRAVADRPAADWSLSADGRRAARDLRDRLPAFASLASSTETKAVETLCAATGAEPAAVRLDERFCEVRRREPFDDGYRERRRAWVSGRLDARHDGWETPEEAAVRFQTGVDALGPGALVCTHGMVLTAWLAHRGHLAAGGPAADFWDRLAFPDLVPVPAGRGPSSTARLP